VSKGYFHFPLCLLAFRRDYKDRLQHIVSYCICEHAKRLTEAPADVPSATKIYDAARFLHVNVTSPEATVDRWKAAKRFIRIWENRFGRDASVRIATALLWEAHDNTGVSYREFSILCAINSIIGRRRLRPRRITEPSIRARAAGFKSWTIAKRELACDQSHAAQLLTSHQVRYTLERLHERRLFARARVGTKTVKYMIGVSDSDLRAWLLQTETHRSRFRAERAEKDRELMMAIKSANKTAVRSLYPDRQGVNSPAGST
jgi:hypothetical protein